MRSHISLLQGIYISRSTLIKMIPHWYFEYQSLSQIAADDDIKRSSSIKVCLKDFVSDCNVLKWYLAQSPMTSGPYILRLYDNIKSITITVHVSNNCSSFKRCDRNENVEIYYKRVIYIVNIYMYVPIKILVYNYTICKTSMLVDISCIQFNLPEIDWLLLGMAKINTCFSHY